MRGPESLETPYIKQEVSDYFVWCLMTALEHGAVDEQTFMELMEDIERIETMEYDEFYTFYQAIEIYRGGE